MKNGGIRTETDSKTNSLGYEAPVQVLDKISAKVLTENRNPVVKLNGTVRITPEARQYAVSELVRRAGVPFSFFKTWRTRWTPDRMILEIPNGVLKQISFPYASAAALKDLAEGKISSARALWMNEISSIQDLVVPFVENPGPKRRLFRLVDQNHLECAFDLPLVILLTLSRWEEGLTSACDVHGRFVASNSIAVREGFLDRPIVDEYGLALEEALEALFPNWKKQERELRVKLSMDADHVGIPFNWKTALKHTTHYHNPLDSGRDILGWIRRGETMELRAMREGVLLARECNLKSAIYWKASAPGPRDSGYDPRDPRLRSMIRWLNGLGAESGIHAGYNTFRSPEKLRREINILREVIGDQPLGGRQHYLRWCPDTWIHWESCGLAYDSTVGFAEQVGFRAGTCVPYRPWLLSLNRQVNLLEVPLIAMDRSLLGYMRLNAEEALAVMTTLMQRCKAVGGVFAALWHNNTLLDPLYRSAYLNMLNACAGVNNYEWRQDNWQAAA